jgi:hypothetical protein
MTVQENLSSSLEGIVYSRDCRAQVLSPVSETFLDANGYQYALTALGLTT